MKPEERKKIAEERKSRWREFREVKENDISVTERNGEIGENKEFETEAITQVKPLKINLNLKMKQSRINFEPKPIEIVPKEDTVIETIEEVKEANELIGSQLDGEVGREVTNLVIRNIEGGSNQKAVNSTINEAEAETETDNVSRDSATNRLTMFGDSRGSTTNKLTVDLDQIHASQMQDKITCIDNKADVVNVIVSNTITVTDNSDSNSGGEFITVKNIGNMSVPLSDNAMLLSVYGKKEDYQKFAKNCQNYQRNYQKCLCIST